MEDKEKKIQIIITAIEEHFPILIRKVVDEFYSPESAGKIGKGLARASMSAFSGTREVSGWRPS